VRINKIKLVGYKRFLLNAIRSFTFTPKEIVQLILGTNGSGKSSLIQELNALPAEASNYSKDGSKEVEIYHNGSTYILLSVFSPSAKHSFIKDSEELNKGGTITVQRELVKQEFGITPMIRDLMIGIEKFTSMSPVKRREWFTMLTPISYDYALSVYSLLKERSRDTTGALKLAKRRLVTETEKIITADEEKKLTKTVTDLHAELNVLLMNTAQLTNPVSFYRDNHAAIIENLGKLSSRLLRLRFIAPYGTNPNQPVVRNDWNEIVTPTFNSIEDIDLYLNRISYDIAVKDTLITKSIEEHKVIQETVDILTKRGNDNISTLRGKCRQLSDASEGLLARRILKIDTPDPVRTLNSLEAIADTLITIFSELPSNEDRIFSRANLNTFNAEHLLDKESKIKLMLELSTLSGKQAHMETHKNNGNVQCPNCKHAWSQGYNPESFAKLVELKAKREAELVTINAVMADREKKIEAIESYIEQYLSFVKAIQNRPELDSFKDHLLSLNLVTNNPRNAIIALEQYRADLKLDINACEFQDELVKLKELILASEQVGDLAESEQRVKLHDSTLLVEQLTHELTCLRNDFSAFTNHKRQLNEALTLGSQITKLMDDAAVASAESVEMLRRETLNHCVRQLQEALAIKQATLSAVLLQKGIVADLEENISVLVIEEEAARLLVKELSPTDGLIAEGLFGFIRNFTGQMNTLLRKIWTYPLQILDCGLANSTYAELDYKFPMLVKDKSNIVTDVSLGSVGQVEVINLAFKIVAMRYLGLSESPLFLDEFAANFDEAHRAQAMGAIKNLMETQPFTQLFMVSHYSASYGALTNAETCVMCPTNITVPKIYNQHVEIES
jgi:energy-coupling factor transporter ATP-binding protein EcfA2